jgi:hypothetical protein
VGLPNREPAAGGVPVGAGQLNSPELVPGFMKTGFFIASKILPEDSGFLFGSVILVERYNYKNPAKLKQQKITNRGKRKL